jgi:diaminopimelate epimerase
MRLRFTKMQGAGNDFVVLDGLQDELRLNGLELERLADRRRGVGCDQVLVVTKPQQRGADHSYRIFNADGSEAEQCGNGVRCIARWLAKRGLIGSRAKLGSKGGVVGVELLDDGDVRADMGVPRFEPRDVPFTAEQRQTSYALSVFGRNHEIGVVSMGNPHAVLRVPSLASAPVAELGPEIEKHLRFPQRANVGFMQRLGSDRIKLRVHERGAGETLACGTGACAAAVWGRLACELGPRVVVELPGGELVVEWNGEGTPAYMTGPAVTVFEGEIEI